MEYIYKQTPDVVKKCDNEIKVYMRLGLLPSLITTWTYYQDPQKHGVESKENIEIKSNYNMQKNRAYDCRHIGAVYECFLTFSIADRYIVCFKEQERNQANQPIKNKWGVMLYREQMTDFPLKFKFDAEVTGSKRNGLFVCRNDLLKTWVLRPVNIRSEMQGKCLLNNSQICFRENAKTLIDSIYQFDSYRDYRTFT